MKRFLAALIFTTAVMSFFPVPLAAQGNRPPPLPPAPAGATAEGRLVQDAESIRAAFQEVLAKYPRSVGRVLRMDPTLFSDPNYLASYPAIAQFVAQYPEVTRSPEYYLQNYALNVESYNRDPASETMAMFRNFFEAMTILMVVVVVGGAVIWLMKGIIDHRRWLRVSKIQTEVHTKLLDRFSSSEELLAYIKTPAGSRFLESAPISIDTKSSPRAASAPLNRILWSVQAGVVLLLAGTSLFVARNYTTFEDVRALLSMMGIFGAFLGLGFILSAGASYVLSQRMGLLEGTGGQPPASVTPGQVDSARL